MPNKQLAVFYTLKSKCEVFLETYYFRSPFFKQEGRGGEGKEGKERKEKVGFRSQMVRLECSISGMPHSTGCSRNWSMEEKVHQENTKVVLCGRRLYLQSPEITLPVGTACLLAATWSGKLRQTDKGGSG